MILLHTMIDPPLRSSNYRYIAIEILPGKDRPRFFVPGRRQPERHQPERRQPERPQPERPQPERRQE